MASGPITSWQIVGETMETVRDFILGGSKITADGDCSHEIKRCLLLGRKAMTNLISILKSRDITLPTKDHLVKAMVFPISSVQFNHLVVSDRLFVTPWTAARQASLSITNSRSPANPCPSSRWYHLTISSSVVPFCSQSFPASGSFPMSQLFADMYGCESWTIKKAECQRSDAFELWHWRRLLRVPWTARRSNQSILKVISPE